MENVCIVPICHGDLHCQLNISIVAKSLVGLGPISWIYVDLNKTASVTLPSKSGLVCWLCNFFLNILMKMNHTKSHLLQPQKALTFNTLLSSLRLWPY